MSDATLPRADVAGCDDVFGAAMEVPCWSEADAAATCPGAVANGCPGAVAPFAAWRPRSSKPYCGAEAAAMAAVEVVAASSSVSSISAALLAANSASCFFFAYTDSS